MSSTTFTEAVVDDPLIPDITTTLWFAKINNKKALIAFGAQDASGQFPVYLMNGNVVSKQLGTVDKTPANDVDDYELELELKSKPAVVFEELKFDFEIIKNYPTLVTSPNNLMDLFQVSTITPINVDTYKTQILNEFLLSKKSTLNDAKVLITNSDGSCGFDTITKAFSSIGLKIETGLLRGILTEDKIIQQFIENILRLSHDEGTREALVSEMNLKNLFDTDKTITNENVFNRETWNDKNNISSLKAFLLTNDFWMEETSIHIISSYLNIGLIHFGRNDEKKTFSVMFNDNDTPRDLYIITYKTSGHYQLISFENKCIFKPDDIKRLQFDSRMFDTKGDTADETKGKTTDETKGKTTVT